eukprot:937455-Pyramimonas_sp.AAC.1
MATFGLVSSPICLNNVISRGGQSIKHTARRMQGSSKAHTVCRADTPREVNMSTTKTEEQARLDIFLSRRASLAAAAGLAFAARDTEWAVAAEEGFFTYERGNRKRFETSISSALRPYTLEVPNNWKEDVVSLNDGKLYGVDLRFGSPDGQLAVSVLPYVFEALKIIPLVGVANRDSITEAGSAEDALDTFIELVGAFWSENGFGDVGRAIGAQASIVT